MSNAVMITLIICVTLIALSLINKKKKSQAEPWKEAKISRGG